MGLSAAAVAALVLGGGGALLTSACDDPNPTESAGSAAEPAGCFRVQRVTKDPTYLPDRWRLEVAGLMERELNLTDARRPEVLLAHKMGGAELPRDQGWPVRLVVPGKWGRADIRSFTSMRRLM